MKTISFFSYKGGAGRSTLAYNIIPILAAEHIQPTAESPIIVVDTDVDSCGMSYLVKAEKEVTETNCIQHLLGNPFDTRPVNNIKNHLIYHVIAILNGIFAVIFIFGPLIVKYPFPLDVFKIFSSTLKSLFNVELAFEYGMR